MEEIAKILYQSYMQTEKWKNEKNPEEMDEIWKKFCPILKKKWQYKLFLDLEACYLELIEIRAINLLEYVLRLIYPEEQ